MTVPVVSDAGVALGSPETAAGGAPATSPPAAGSARASSAGAARLNVRAVFDEHYDFVWRSLRRLGVAEADVDDAVQEVFVVVHRKLADFAGRSKLSTWLYGICFRVASEFVRRGPARHEQSSEGLPEPIDPAASPEERYEGREARAKLDEVLAKLDLEKRAVFVLYEIDEVPVEVIADALSIPVGTVYSRLKAAREEFERALSRMRLQWARESRRSGA